MHDNYDIINYLTLFPHGQQQRKITDNQVLKS